MLANGMSLNTVRKYFSHKYTRAKPLAKMTFCKAFEEEIYIARVERVNEAASSIYAQMKQGDLAAARNILNLQGRGLFNPKFKFVASGSIEQQINTVLRAGSKGKISAEEVGHYCTAIKMKAENKLDKILDILRELVSKDLLNADKLADVLGE